MTSLSQMGPQDYVPFDMMNNMPKPYPYYYDHRMKSVMDPQAQYTMDLIGLTSDQQSIPDMKQEYCRDYQRGKCMRGSKCKYRHADNVDMNVRETPNPKIVFCRNYQRGKCSLANCKYLHLSRADEEFYYQTGALPTHDNNYNGFLHNFPTQNNSTEQTSSLASLVKPFQPGNSLPLTTTTQSTPLDAVSTIPIPNEQSLQDPFYKQSSPKSESPFSPTSESSHSEKSKTPPQKSLSHSTQSISEFLGGKQDGTRTRRWSIDNTDQPDEMSHKLSPLSLTSQDEAFKNPEVDLMKIKLHQFEEKVKSLEFYNDILREQNMQLKQQVKRYENPFSPIYKPIIQEDNDISSNN